jgi:hypothetical protein
LKEYQQLKHIKSLKVLMQNEEEFYNQVKSSDFVSVVAMYDSLHLLMNEHK